MHYVLESVNLLVQDKGYRKSDVIEVFYRTSLFMYVDHKRETTGDFAIEEIVKYLQNWREEKHEVNWAGVGVSCLKVGEGQ